MDVRKEILEFMTTSTEIKNIREAYPQWDKTMTLHVLEDIAEDLEENLKDDLRYKIRLYELGGDA